MGPVRLCMAAVLLAVLFPLTAGAVQEDPPGNREDEEPFFFHLQQAQFRKKTRITGKTKNQ